VLTRPRFGGVNLTAALAALGVVYNASVAPYGVQSANFSGNDSLLSAAQLQDTSANIDPSQLSNSMDIDPLSGRTVRSSFMTQYNILLFGNAGAGQNLNVSSYTNFAGLVLYPLAWVNAYTEYSKETLTALSAELVVTHQSTSTRPVAFLAAGAVIGGLMMILGTTYLLWYFFAASPATPAAPASTATMGTALPSAPLGRSPTAEGADGRASTEMSSASAAHRENETPVLLTDSRSAV